MSLFSISCARYRTLYVAFKASINVIKDIGQSRIVAVFRAVAEHHAFIRANRPFSRPEKQLLLITHNSATFLKMQEVYLELKDEGVLGPGQIFFQQRIHLHAERSRYNQHVKISKKTCRPGAPVRGDRTAFHVNGARPLLSSDPLRHDSAGLS